jgi:D-glycero-D-manno-heptose 1,7-bisphosphate phosphatase
MKFYHYLRRLFTRRKLQGHTLLLDRDGTINVDTGYVSNPGEISLEKGALKGLSMLDAAGVEFVVLTNQSGIGRGYYESQDLLLVNNRIDSLLAEEELYIKRYFACPHAPDAGCRCRKPRVGLFKQFQKACPDDIPLAMIGDKLSDISMLERYQIPSILVRTGEGRKTEEQLDKDRPSNLAAVVDDLEDAARFILSGGLARFIREQQETEA